PAPKSEIERVFRREEGRAVAVLIRSFRAIVATEDAVWHAFALGRPALAGRGRPTRPGRVDHHPPASRAFAAPRAGFLGRGSTGQRYARPPRACAPREGPPG